jgi:putative nucleotidyltransferase with HDIG domain
MMPMSIDDLIQRIGDLPPMPQAAQKALVMMRDPDTNAMDLANVLSMDQALTSLLLRWANSAFYGLRNSTATVQQAVMVLGQNTVHNLIIAASVAVYLDRPVPGYALDRGELWKHSIGVAAGARLIAEPFGKKFADEAYHAGLLCDIGKLGFEVLLRQTDIDRVEWQGYSFTDLEKAKFGIDHASLGAEMAHRWRLPETLVSVIACHHRPSAAGDNLVLASSVHLADAAMMMMGIGVGRDGLQYELDPAALQCLGWNDSNMADLLRRINDVVEESSRFIGFNWQDNTAFDKNARKK